MKKIIIIILCTFIIFCISGCNNKNNDIVNNDEFEEIIYNLELDKIYKWELNGNIKTIELKSDYTVETSSSSNNTEIKYTGTFEIKDNTLILTLDEYYNSTEWIVLPNDNIIIYEITEENKFKNINNETEQFFYPN